ncbi:MAG: phage tail protein, partial [Clostridia bacterium]|nr:phage tail protein [Clostridia bacterium]
NCVITKELMREHNLKFSITNDNPFYKLLRSDGAFECDGQIFDIVDIDTESGVSNVTQIAADHVSYRLSDYMIPDNYSYVGTLPEIVADILEQGVNINNEKANTIFSVGECYDGLGSITYGLIGQENITVRAALLGLTYLGIEVDFDNFTINCPKRLGADNGVTFDFNTNLMKFRRRWERDNDWTYDVDIADRGDIALGDDIIVHDTFVGDEVKKRIITYERCIDNPTRNAVTLGSFILDSAAASVETGLALDGLTSQMGNSVQQGKQYNNVAITHELGFVSERKDNKIRVIANGTDCFAVQKNVNGVWVTVTEADEEGIASTVLTTPNAKNAYYATVGKNSAGNVGLFLYYYIDGKWQSHLEFWPSKNGNTVIESKRGDLILMSPAGRKVYFEEKDVGPYGSTGTVRLGNADLTFKNGLFTDVKYKI